MFYSILGGMHSIVVGDVIKYIIMTIGCLAIGIIAFTNMQGKTLNVPAGWLNPFFGWNLDLDWSRIIADANKKIQDDKFGLFGFFFMMMLFKGIFASLAGPAPNYDMQKVLSTRSPKEASKMTGFVSIVLLPIRYSMVIGLTVLALLYYNKLNVSSPAGTDFERVFPAAINTFLPVGLLGLVLTGLLGAFMGTFSGTVNAAQAYIVNDIYLKYINPDAPTKRIIAMNYMTGVVVVALGVILGFFAKDVNSILQWIVGALYGGYIAANMLKWYWWRFTGKATIVPKWAVGFWQSRERYKTQNEILNTVDEFRKRKIPLDNIVLDWSYWKENDWGSQEFDATRFPNPDSMIKVLHNKYNTHFMISVWPKFYEGKG